MIDAIVEEIEIEASPQAVFAAWTTPEQMVEWWGEDGFYRVTKWRADLRVGGKWRSDGVSADGKKFAVEGEYLRFDPPKYLSFTWKHDWEENSSVTTVELELHPTRRGTLLKLKHHGFTVQASRDDHKKGWARVLGWLRGYMEKSELTRTSH